MRIPAEPHQGATARPDGSVRWRVWAPRQERVELVLIDGGRRTVPLEREPHGYFSVTLPDVPEGRRYLYRLGGGAERGDPAARWQPDGVTGPSAVLRPEQFRWTDHGWRGVPRVDLVIYELHVGTFTPGGTFDDVIPRLPALKELGVTAVEVMPVAQFPGGRNWGYDGVFPYAVQNTYGGPHGLMRLVDACHAQGLAVVLDVVYNHLGPEGNYLREFGPYFTDRYRTPWGEAVNYDGPGSDPVRDYVLDNVRLWLTDYHIDALRLDAVQAIYDLGPRHILRAIKAAADEAADRRGRPALVIAESDLNDPRLLRPPEQGGYGLDAQWSDDFHHAVHAYLTGERRGYYADFGRPEDLAAVLERPFLFDGKFSRHRDRTHGAPAGDLPGDRFVVCIQNHDQVGNRAQGDRLDALLSEPARRLAACLLLLSPHVPLIFMGEEYGETNPFPFFCYFQDGRLAQAVREGRRREFAAFAWQGEVPDPQAESTFASARLSWSWGGDPRRAGLRRLYADLLAARRRWPALRDFTDHAARLLPGDGPTALALTRGRGGSAVHAVFNLTDRPQPWPDPPAGTRPVLCSESTRYGGGRAGDGGGQLLPSECVIFTGRGD
jgi:maltooligosyltrehalose trehalohydrolase